MTIEIDYINADMSEGLWLVQKDPFTNRLKLDWSEVNAAISLLLAHRELAQAKDRLGFKPALSIPGIKDED